jgi:hypothetical protein
VRRKRRQRIGLKLNDWLRNRDEHANEWYYRKGEKNVTRRMREVQMVVNLEEHSDSESHDSEEEDHEDESDEEDSKTHDRSKSKHRRQQSSIDSEIKLAKRSKK